MKIIETDILIQSSPAKVWMVLTDFQRYPDWNPFIQEASGEVETGARLKVRIAPPGWKPMTIQPMVCTVSSGAELRWIGHLVFPGLFDGEHVFQIEQAGQDQVRFRQSEQFRGILVPFFPSTLYERTRRGFEAMNQALKETVEKLHGKES
ncbi:activator of Hsp90 ATPase 1 family protein [Candidatus Vecturithrix granuli]|uniref:Activator of Hsp90 ATPase 1 family protein n=1 Tax=Vecturithrix granuli TaxID=1499967 RepID=A0A081C7A8_VECG1|nr:activator of Hsp90 ATPase 1 family protein [Candidatus Vecturithrix granuli]